VTKRYISTRRKSENKSVTIPKERPIFPESRYDFLSFLLKYKSIPNIVENRPHKNEVKTIMIEKFRPKEPTTKRMNPTTPKTKTVMLRFLCSSPIIIQALFVCRLMVKTLFAHFGVLGIKLLPVSVFIK
jgi:hypothetical protein